MFLSPPLRRSPRLWLIALLALGAAALLSPSSASAKAPAVYTQTNDPANNEVVVFDRDSDGSITEIQRVSTGGQGRHGNPPFGQAHLDSTGAVELTDNGRLLFAVNAGSDTVSSFAVRPDGTLRLVDQESTDGTRPISADSHKGLLYALNLDTGTITGLHYDNRGRMTPISGSTKPLSVTSGDRGLPSQVTFNPQGTVLSVTLRLAKRIDTFAVHADGTTGPAVPNAADADLPFAMDWDNRGHLIVSNAGRFGDPFGDPTSFPGSGSSYGLDGTTLTALDNESSGARATCWVVVTASGKYAFMSNTLSNTVSRFRISPDGDLTLLGVTPTSLLATGFTAPTDVGLSGNSKYLYVLNVFRPQATIDVYRVRNGNLTHLGEVSSSLSEGLTGLAAK